MHRSKEAKYCLMRDNGDLKDLIKFRMKEQSISVKALSASTGIDDYRIYRYLRDSHYDSLSSVTQYQLQHMICRDLGIEMELKFTLLPIHK